MVGGVGPQRTHSQPTFVQVRRPLAIVIAKGLVIKENRHTTINALSLKVSQTIKIRLHGKHNRRAGYVTCNFSLDIIPFKSVISN